MSAVDFGSLEFSIVIFVLATASITLAGVLMSKTADRLADRTGWGEAVIGSLFLAGATSLPDFAATVTAASAGYAELAMGNMMGSLALNLVFLCLGDIVYRQANLEHAAASLPNMAAAALMIALIAIPLLAMLGPEVVFWHIHPATVILLGAYLFGLNLLRNAHLAPMWTPRHTAQTVDDLPDKKKGGPSRLSVLWLHFAALSLILALSGWAMMSAASAISLHTGLSQTLVGTLLTALSTSMPELVTTIAAVRQGALTLAVAGIVGTNCFNMTAIAAADIAYREGSIYHDVTQQQIFWGLLTILMAAILLLGFVRREKFGIGRIGFESFAILVLYAAAAALVIAGG
ncbi:MAG: sodium:calcium antiporter [Gammaproteobacteria bacterium]